MKHFFTVVISLIALITSLRVLDINVAAYDPPLPFSTFSNGLDEGEYIEIWKKVNAEKDFTLRNNQKIRVTSLNTTNGKLVIMNGTTATIKGDIFIERGGVLYIEDGNVIINGGNITNCGTIKIGEKGALKVLSGTLNSTAAGSIQNGGKITCLSTGKRLNGYFKSIKKYDSNFNLSDYTLFIDSKEDSARVTVNYCMNDIMTNYKYKFDLDTSSKKIKIVRTNYSLETVYNPKTQQKLQKRVSLFEKEHSNECDFKMWYWQDYGYIYNYKSNELIYNAKWVVYDDLNDTFIEKDFSGKA